MTTFDDRENAFEAHYAFEEELEFKVRARRDRLTALWAGGMMGLSGEALEAYVGEVVHADLSETSGEELYQKVLSDFGGRGVSVRPQDLRIQIMALTDEARREVGVDSQADRVRAD